MAKYFEQGQYNKSIVKLNKESHNMDYLLVLKKIWSEVLKTNLIHIEDNFFFFRRRLNTQYDGCF